jgi:hypothetical protein
MGKTFRKKQCGHGSRRQKLYKMRGCAGGAGVPLAYTGEPIPTVPNPFLAYTGKGGSMDLTPPATVPVNTNALNPAEPNTGPPRSFNTTFNIASQQLGGCGGTCGLMRGGGGGCGCGLPFLGGKKQKGGNTGGQPYPNGLVGQPWTPNVNTWPDVDKIGGNHNYYANNTLQGVDISRKMVDVGANPPFLKGGRRKNRKSTRRAKSRRVQRGGTLSNFLSQDLINLGRQFQFGMGSAYNALAGYPSPVNPMPWRDQFSHANK